VGVHESLPVFLHVLCNFDTLGRRRRWVS